MPTHLATPPHGSATTPDTPVPKELTRNSSPSQITIRPHSQETLRQHWKAQAKKPQTPTRPYVNSHPTIPNQNPRARQTYTPPTKLSSPYPTMQDTLRRECSGGQQSRVVLGCCDRRTGQGDQQSGSGQPRSHQRRPLHDRRTRIVQSFEYELVVLGWLDLAQHRRDLAVGVDDEGGAFVAQYVLPYIDFSTQTP